MSTFQEADVTFKLAIPLKTHVLNARGSTHTLDPHCTMYMLDRNAISDIVGTTATNENQRLWLSFLDRPGIHLTSVFADLEGDQRRRPTFDEYVGLLGNSQAKLQSFFKHATIAAFSPESAERVHNELVAAGASIPDKMRFYLEACNVVKSTVKTGHERALEDALLQIAERHKVGVRSFVFIAFLAALYRKENSAAYNLLLKKKKGDMSPEDMAYNATADCCHLEMLATALKHFPSVGLVTGDAAMAGFWRGFQVSGVGDTFAVKVRPAVLPRLHPDRATMVLARLGVPVAVDPVRTLHPK